MLARFLLHRGRRVTGWFSVIFHHELPPDGRGGGLLGGRPDLCQFWLSGDRFSCVPNRCRSALGAGRVCECGGLSRKRGAHVREVRATGAHAGARKLRSRYADTHDPRSRYADKECPTPPRRGGRGRRAGGWPDVSCKGKATSGWGKRSRKGKRGRGAPLAPAGIGDDAARFRSRRSVGAYVRCVLRHRCKGPTRVQRGCSLATTPDGAAGNAGNADNGGRSADNDRVAATCDGLPLAVEGGCRQRAMPPQDAPLQRLPPQRRVTTPPPGTARAPGGGSALRRALSTAGTQSIPAGRSAP